MDFSAFPAQWEWVALILGGVAFIMAVQPFTQFIWGRPRIEIEFGARDEDGLRYLDIFLYNRPVTSRLLKSIKIHRDTAKDVFVEYNIQNTQTDKVYADMYIPKIEAIQQEGYSISLPGSTTPASITLIMARSNGDVFVRGYEKPDIKLIPGKYCLTVKVHCGEIKVEKQAYFSVGESAYELCWDAVSAS